MHRDTTVTKSQSYAVQQADSTATPRVLFQQTLSEQEVERICKAFIQLITAPTTHTEEKGTHAKRAANRAKNKRK